MGVGKLRHENGAQVPIKKKKRRQGAVQRVQFISEIESSQHRIRRHQPNKNPPGGGGEEKGSRDVKGKGNSGREPKFLEGATGRKVQSAFLFTEPF